MTSYRSSPEITELFTSLLSNRERVQISSVHREGTRPVLREVVNSNTDTQRICYLDALREAIGEAADNGGLTAVIAQDKQRVRWLEKQLSNTTLSREKNDMPAGKKQDVPPHNKPLVTVVTSQDTLPAQGVVLLDLALAKGLEFDRVIIADAQAEVYGNDELSRRRLYTAISRAMHRVTIVSQGPMAPLLTAYLKDGCAGI